MSGEKRIYTVIRCHVEISGILQPFPRDYEDRTKIAAETHSGTAKKLDPLIPGFSALCARLNGGPYVGDYLVIKGDRCEARAKTTKYFHGAHMVWMVFDITIQRRVVLASALKGIPRLDV